MDTIQLLIDSGANLSSQTNNGRTVLHTAAYLGGEAVAQLLLENRVDISVVENNGRTALDLATSRRNEAMIRLLLQKGVNYPILYSKGQTVLHTAIMKGDQTITRLLLENGFDYPIPDSEGRTALQLAAAGFHNTSLQQRRNPSYKSSETYERCWDVIYLLLMNGADLYSPDQNRVTALNDAILANDIELTQLLFEKGSSLLRDDGFVLLRMPASQNQAAMVKLLLEKGVDPSGRGKDGQTILHIAVEGLITNQHDTCTI